MTLQHRDWEQSEDEAEAADTGIVAPRKANGPRWLTPLCLLVGVVGVGLLWYARADNGPHSHSFRRRNGQGTGPGRDFRGFPGQMFMGGMRPPQFAPRLQRRPLYVANLAAQTGPYVVSVRQVIIGGYQATLHSNVPPGAHIPAPDVMRLSMQVMAPNEADVDSATDFTAHCTAEDETGKTLVVTPVTIDARFPNGKGGMVEVQGLAPDAHLIRRLQGTLERTRNSMDANGNATRIVTSLPFRIDNIPLPNAFHVFGLVAAAPLQASDLKRLKVGASGQLMTPVLLSEDRRSL